METKQQVKRPVAVLAVVAVLIATGVLVWASRDDGMPRAPGPAGRATAAIGAGAPAVTTDLAALIGDRRTWLRKHPHDDTSWALLGSAYLERGRNTSDPADFPRAEMALRHSLSVRPRGNPHALTGLAALAHARGDYRTAKKWAEAARKQSPKSWTAYPPLIATYTQLGDQQAATEAVEKLEALHPSASVRRLAADVYRDRGWREDAAAALSDATALAGSTAEKAAGLHRLGELAWERGEPEEALGHYESTLRTDPTHARARVGRARVMAALGRPTDAESDYRSAVSTTPLPEINYEYGEFLESVARETEAQHQYALVRARAALTEHRGGGSNDLLLGQLEADHGDPATAVHTLRAEWKRHPNPQVADALAWALYRSGEPSEALTYARKATTHGPRNAQFFYHLATIEKDLNKTGAARRHLEEALRINPSFSPLLAPRAREELNALGDPPEGSAPVNLQGPAQPPTRAG